MRQWVLGLASTCLICAVLTEISPAGAVKNVVRAMCGTVMALALIAPLLSTDAESYSLNMAKYRQMAWEIENSGSDLSRRLQRDVIEQECRAYILDKAEDFGLEISDASVKLKWSSEGLWYPVECRLWCSPDPRLANAIASELGIPQQAQEWVTG